MDKPYDLNEEITRGIIALRQENERLKAENAQLLDSYRWMESRMGKALRLLHQAKVLASPQYETSPQKAGFLQDLVTFLSEYPSSPLRG